MQCLMDLVLKLKEENKEFKVISAFVLCRCFIELFNIDQFTKQCQSIVSLFSPTFDGYKCPEHQAVLRALPKIE